MTNAVTCGNVNMLSGYSDREAGPRGVSPQVRAPIAAEWEVSRVVYGFQQMHFVTEFTKGVM